MINYESEFRNLLLHILEQSCENPNSQSSKDTIVYEYAQNIYPKIHTVEIALHESGTFFNNKDYIVVEVYIQEHDDNLPNRTIFHSRAKEFIDYFKRYQQNYASVTELRNQKKANEKLNLIRTAIGNVFDNGSN